jgi:hypothetical protein
VIIIGLGKGEPPRLIGVLRIGLVPRYGVVQSTVHHEQLLSIHISWDFGTPIFNLLLFKLINLASNIQRDHARPRLKAEMIPKWEIRAATDGVMGWLRL